MLLAVAVLTGCAQAAGGAAPDPAVAQEDTPRHSPLGDFLAGHYAQSERDNAAAADYFLSALRSDPGNTMLLRPAMLLLVSSGAPGNAKPLALRILADSPDDPAANLILSALDLHDGDDADARRRLAHLPHSSFNALLVPLLSAWADVGGGPASAASVDAALAQLKLLEATPAFAPFQYLHTAYIADVSGRTGPALEAYQQAMRATRGTALRVVEAYGNFLTRQGQKAMAESVYRTFLQQAPDNPIIRQADADLQAGKPALALVGNARDGAAEAFSGVAAALSRQDTSDAGRIYVQLAIYLRPDLASAKTLLADIDEQAQRYEDALAVYRSIDPRSPYGESVQLREAWVLEQLNRRDEAESLLRALASKQPDNIDVLVTLGDVLRAGDKYGEAAAEYTAALKLSGPQDERAWSLLYARGIAYERSKQWPLAEADFLKALKLKPDQPMVLNYLGYSWVERKEHVDRARHMIERAMQQRPNDGYIVDSLGWVMYRLGRYNDAVKQLERAVELVPSDPTINDHLGDAYWRVGRRTEARYQWERALTYKPDQDQVPLIEAKLNSGLNAANSVRTRRRGG